LIGKTYFNKFLEQPDEGVHNADRAIKPVMLKIFRQDFCNGPHFLDTKMALS